MTEKYRISSIDREWFFPNMRAQSKSSKHIPETKYNLINVQFQRFDRAGDRIALTLSFFYNFFNFFPIDLICNCTVDGRDSLLNLQIEKVRSMCTRARPGCDQYLDWDPVGECVWTAKGIA